MCPDEKTEKGEKADKIIQKNCELKLQINFYYYALSFPWPFPSPQTRNVKLHAQT